MPLSDIEQLRIQTRNLTATGQYLADRLLAELSFAEGLAKQHPPDRQAAWGRLIAKAVRAARPAIEGRKLGSLEKVLNEVEEILAPVGKVAKQYTVHCVGHAHIDMNWLWSWPETVSVTNDTFITVLKLMEEFPDFCFSQSQASVYAIVREYNPELLEPIRRRIKEGRWEVTATQWVEGDKNIACGEALARHLLYARRFMQEQFDLSPEDVKLDWECDMFGHAWTIPTILARGGATRYYMCRGGCPDTPPVFWWRGPDGARVMVVRDFTGYNDQLGLHVAGNLLRFCRWTGLKDWMDVYGMGDHGGGPTRRDILRVRDMTAWPVYPNFRLTTTGAFYDVLEAHADKWPVLSKEINFEFTGCYTTQTMIKKGNRYGENYCLEAETSAALARQAAGRAYPARQLRDAWIDVLFGQFHDILPGSGVHWTREYQVGLFQKVAAATSMMKTHSYRAVAGAVDTSAALVKLPAAAPGNESAAMGAGVGRGAMLGGLSTAAHVIDGPRPFVVFNPTAWRRGEVVSASLWDTETGISPGDIKAKDFTVRTAGGKVIPAQKTGSGNYWGHNFVDVVFPVSVGGLGYGTVVVEEGAVEDYAGGVKTYEVPPRHEPHAPTAPAMENKLLAVEFDAITGGVVKLLDKVSGKDLADPADPLGVLEFVLERPRGMSAWIIGGTQRRCRKLEVKSLERGLTGPHLATVVAKLKVESSDVTITYALKAGTPWLEITIETTWVERGGREVGTPSLRMRFPLALRQARGRYEIPFGSIQRELNAGQEVPALRWADVTGKLGAATAGCALLNDCKYGHALDGNALSVTLIRSSYEPDPLPEIGEHVIRLAVAPHGAALPPAELVKLGAAFNHPLQVVATDAHTGVLPPDAAGATGVSPDNVILSSVKQAEDGDGLVFRLFDAGGKAATAKVTLDPVLFGTPVEAVEVDLIERAVEPSSARTIPGGFAVNVPASGIAGVKVKLEK